MIFGPFFGAILKTSYLNQLAKFFVISRRHAMFDSYCIDHTVWTIHEPSNRPILNSVSNQSPYEKCIKAFDRRTDIVNNAVAWSKVRFN